MALTRLAHQLITAHFQDRPKKFSVDATCGNGHDTEFLARLGFNKIVAFDIQPQALAATEQRLANMEDIIVDLVHDGHENLAHYTATTVDCVMFNLGYLPHTDKTLTTLAETTLRALKSATERLSEQGLISVLCYPGHKNGAIETSRIKDWLTELESQSKDRWHIECHLSASPSNTAPVLYILKKRTSH